MGVAGANMQWGHFVCPVAVKRGRTPAFQLALWDFLVPESKLVEVVLHVRNGAKFGVKKVNGGQNICSGDASVGNGKNF